MVKRLATPPLITSQILSSYLSNRTQYITQLRTTIHDLHDYLARNFSPTADIQLLMQKFVVTIDLILRHLWQIHIANNHSLTLLAVGGYGRGELCPYSDIDLLILSATPLNTHATAGVQGFIQTCWDIGLSIGHSVRTLEECVNTAREDVTVMTNLCETFRLIGSKRLAQALHMQLTPQHMWSHQAFFTAKLNEQHARYAKHSNTANNLEPNIKLSPGGLRDIHIIQWLAKRILGTNEFEALVNEKFLLPEEATAIQKIREYLLRLRYALHLTTKRQEDRLLLGNQKILAELFGYHAHTPNQAVEQFMKDYFNIIKPLRELHDLGIQLFTEKLQAPPQIVSINQYFDNIDNFINIKTPTLYFEHPHLVIETFNLLAHSNNYSGLTANTIRSLRAIKLKLSNKIKYDVVTTQALRQLFSPKPQTYLALHTMNRYGILGALLPEFGHIVGQMQFDLFHIYTVDQHTLFLIKNILDFYHTEKFLLCQQLIKKLKQPELLIIAALFHDIGKGRGGNHSDLGASYAQRFCQQLGYTAAETALVSWLVQHHLLMSTTAQRKDIYDPDVLDEFAQQIPHETYLIQLYLLTVADINATNPRLWNSWKDSLLKQLFTTTRAILTTTDKAFSANKIIKAKQQHALTQLTKSNYSETTIKNLWKQFGNYYFLRGSALSIAKQTLAILQHQNPDEPLVLIDNHSSHGATEIFIYTRDKPNLFATSAIVISNHQLNILEAHIITSKHGYSLDTYLVLDDQQRKVTHNYLLYHLQKDLFHFHSSHTLLPRYRERRQPGHLRYFTIETIIKFSVDTKNQRTVLDISCADQFGLLARIGIIFAKLALRVQGAKISTLGEKIEDVFFITNEENRPLNSNELEKLTQLLHTELALQ